MLHSNFKNVLHGDRVLNWKENLKIIGYDAYLRTVCAIFDIRLITEKFHLQSYFFIFTLRT